MRAWRLVQSTVARCDNRGAWLDVEGEEILLPRREVPDEVHGGESVEVYLYRDGERVKATRAVPAVDVGSLGMLRVKELTPIGAFLDWGLPKDLLVPFAEQAEPMRQGRRYLVRVCEDNQGRVVGSTRLERHLEPGLPPYTGGEEVELLLWRFTPLGVAVVVDERFEGLIYRDELQGKMRSGDRLHGRVLRVRDDGKLDITLRRSPREERDEAQELLLESLRLKGGFLPLHDRSSPQEIYSQLHMSKKLFKKAIGGLLKRGAVQLEESGIRLVEAPRHPSS